MVTKKLPQENCGSKKYQNQKKSEILCGFSVDDVWF